MSSGRMITADELRELLGQGGSKDEARPSPPDVLIMTLREYLADYTANNRFKVGDIITSKKSGPLGQFHGRPSIVAEIFDPPIRIQGRADKVQDMNFGGRIDIRFLHEVGSVICSHVGESWMFEPYAAAADSDGPKN